MEHAKILTAHLRVENKAEFMIKFSLKYFGANNKLVVERGEVSPTNYKHVLFPTNVDYALMTVHIYYSMTMTAILYYHELDSERHYGFVTIGTLQNPSIVFENPAVSAGYFKGVKYPFN
ncbi:hypothetical protein V9T40_005856 [Parthenolecanium corni]|uniref:Uncharacterized protein n=1 Tax=Parthenolecanium corni TaxID=536013 RepID=A0AAN9YBE3_9HEMI